MADSIQADYHLYKMKKVINPDATLDTLAEVYKINGKLEMLSDVMDLIKKESENEKN